MTDRKQVEPDNQVVDSKLHDVGVPKLFSLSREDSHPMNSQMRKLRSQPETNSKSLQKFPIKSPGERKTSQRLPSSDNYIQRNSTILL